MFDPCCRVHSLDGITMLSHLWRIMESYDSGGHAGCREGSSWGSPFGSKWLMLPLTRAAPGLG